MTKAEREAAAIEVACAELDRRGVTWREDHLAVSSWPWGHVVRASRMRSAPVTVLVNRRADRVISVRAPGHGSRAARNEQSDG